MSNDEHYAALERSIEILFRTVWSVTLGASVRAFERSGRESIGSMGELRASVRIRGERSADVTLVCPRETVCEFTAALLRKPMETLAEHELQATMVELIQVFGGGIVGVLPGENAVSEPVVSASSHAAESAEPGRLQCASQLDFRGWPCRLEVRSLQP